MNPLFKTLRIFILTQPVDDVLSAFKAGLQKHPFTPCKATMESSAGFIELPGDGYTHDVNGVTVFGVKFHNKKIPAGALEELTATRVQELESKGEEVSKKLRREIKEQIKQDLMPNTPPTPTYVYGYVDRELNMMMINAGSEKVADEVVELLSKTLKGLPFRLLGINKELEDIFTGWLRDPNLLGQTLRLGDSCSLKDHEAPPAIIHIQRDELTGDEMNAHLEADKVCIRITLRSEDVTFAINDKLTIGSLTFNNQLLREAKEGAEDELALQDANLTIMTNAVRKMVGQLEELLGGWPTQEQMDLAQQQEDAA